MVETLLVFAIGLIPALVSLVLMQKAETRARQRLQTAMNSSSLYRLSRVYGHPLAGDHRYVEGIGYLMGDITCQFNARSAYIRCAVNPSGPCKDCSHYESIEFN